MNIVVLYREIDEKTGKSTLSVSHGVDYYTDKPVVLSGGTPEEIGAVYDPELREYVLITPSTKAEDRIRAHAGFTESAKAAMALFLPNVKTVEILSKETERELDPSSWSEPSLSKLCPNANMCNLLVRQTFEDGQRYLFSGVTWKSLCSEIVNFHKVRVTNMGMAMLGKTQAIEASKDIYEQLENLVIRATECERLLKFTKLKPSEGQKPTWSSVFSWTEQVKNEDRAKETRIFKGLTLVQAFERLSKEDRELKASLTSVQLMGLVRSGCGYVENGTSTSLRLVYEARSKEWIALDNYGQIKAHNPLLCNVLNENSQDRIFVNENAQAAEAFGAVLKWIQDNPGHCLSVFQDDATSSWHIKIYPPGVDASESLGPLKQIFENIEYRGFDAAWISIQDEIQAATNQTAPAVK